jgi:Ca2+-binding EF-hand superfamily protein
MRLLSTSILALCATTLLSTSLQAQTPDKQDGDRRSAMRARLDTDGDGKISAEEAQAARKAFQERGGIQSLPEPLRQAIIKRLDRDADGKVSEQERQAGLKAMADRWRSRGNQSRPGPGQDRRPDAQDRRPDTQGRRPDAQDRRPDAQGRRPDAQDRRPDARDRRPDAQGKRPDAQGRRPDAQDRRPDAQGRRPDAQGSGLGHLARFDLNGDGVIDASEAQRARALFQRHRGQGGNDKRTDSPGDRARSNQPPQARGSRPGRGFEPGQRGQRGNVRGEGGQQQRGARGRSQGRDHAQRRPMPEGLRRRMQSMEDEKGRGQHDRRRQDRR